MLVGILSATVSPGVTRDRKFLDAEWAGRDFSIVDTGGWLAAGDSMAIHFNDTAEVDSSGVGGSKATWNGMQSVISTAITSFAATYPNAPFPVSTTDASEV